MPLGADWCRFRGEIAGTAVYLFFLIEIIQKKRSNSPSLECNNDHLYLIVSLIFECGQKKYGTAFVFMFCGV